MLAPDALFCSDGAGVYRGTARQFGLAHESINVTAGQHVRQQFFHVQHVNAYDAKLTATQTTVIKAVSARRQRIAAQTRASAGATGRKKPDR